VGLGEVADNHLQASRERFNRAGQRADGRVPDSRRGGDCPGQTFRQPRGLRVDQHPAVETGLTPALNIALLVLPRRAVGPLARGDLLPVASVSVLDRPQVPHAVPGIRLSRRPSNRSRAQVSNCGAPFGEQGHCDTVRTSPRCLALVVLWARKARSRASGSRGSYEMSIWPVSIRACWLIVISCEGIPLPENEGMPRWPWQRWRSFSY